MNKNINCTNLSKSLTDYDILKNIEGLIDYEKSINEKIVNNKPLTFEEYFFIKYSYSPTRILKSLLKEEEKNEKNFSW